MNNVFARKLRNAGPLGPDDMERLEQVISDPFELGAREDLIHHGDDPENVHLVLTGMACRYKILPDGSRAIVALMLPGDICDLHVAILGQMDHSIGTLTDCQIVRIPKNTIADLLDNYPRIRHALFWSTLVDEAILREWLVNMGRRRSDHQMAHLFCEVHTRLAAVDQLYDSLMPLTQEELGDILGISSVHAQRVISGLRNQGLINVQDSRVSVQDFDALSEFAEFEADYLHLGEGRANGVDATAEHGAGRSPA
ncbi:Crp/Fnr family transcriptional regulator [Maritimibacter sp. UBA3975]|uniref:Crp/Fnr family transcriptional regulator n=1 Tax=Maritimibacter sp. UBA3975 TaxID=1946833 RepID=UPI000C0A29EB|nr:Crp/Fnr family transcriptional regulator [Maritimibacter sp. UBA3975]MAM62981.1 cyclic nucleotide-binding protein [Maritimibacter sp.]|tara:strand:+ start:19394 stop:20155 length:762 start_codon:yes stop_codon:yes gene_type:complete